MSICITSTHCIGLHWIPHFLAYLRHTAMRSIKLRHMIWLTNDIPSHSTHAHTHARARTNSITCSCLNTSQPQAIQLFILLPIFPSPQRKCGVLCTSSSRVFLQRLTVPQLVKKFPAFLGTRRFITAFTTDRHVSLP